MDSKVMILDDEPYNVMVVRKYLRDAGYSNLLALTDSSEALETIAREKPSLLLLDIVMPRQAGWTSFGPFDWMNKRGVSRC